MPLPCTLPLCPWNQKQVSSQQRQHVKGSGAAGVSLPIAVGHRARMADPPAVKPDCSGCCLRVSSSWILARRNWALLSREQTRLRLEDSCCSLRADLCLWQPSRTTPPSSPLGSCQIPSLSETARKVWLWLIQQRRLVALLKQSHSPVVQQNWSFCNISLSHLWIRLCRFCREGDLLRARRTQSIFFNTRAEITIWPVEWYGGTANKWQR